ncbi:MAG TPA: non-canonical purine NTP pyrophosphatase [Syntrophomonas sp.]|jgi:XTP/dITP diphosphohydrolase|nr:non-canonical purine NTP pyrophosphatase [Syntrophomonas sp.]HCF72104.1 non-canonical purine NTP pyrophosphatase [Syntrophomonas sp.]
MSKDRLLLSTRNLHKRREMEEILKDLDVEVLTLDEVGISTVIEEDGATFAANAIKKAGTIAILSDCITLADDSGLVVDALDGAPGIYSARFAGENATDQDNNLKLMKLLQEVEIPLRTARFVCMIAICTPQGKTFTVEGRCEGRIGLTPRGQGGFGYDPLFIPEGYDQSFAELGEAVKNRISHRARALQEARKVLQEVFGR